MNKDIIKKVIIFFGLVGLYSLIMYMLGLESCLIYITTGIPCPSCGFTRAYISLLQLNLGQALFYNPMFWVPIFVAIFEVFIHLKKVNEKHRVKVYLTLTIAMIVVWLGRMILLFPDTYPMLYNYNSIFYKIYSLFF